MKWRNKAICIAAIAAFVLSLIACADLKKPKEAARNAKTENTVKQIMTAVMDLPAAAPAEPAAGDMSGEKATEKIIGTRGRKLIHEGRMSIKVAEVEKARESVEKMVKEAGGFISGMNIQRETSAKTIEMTLRIPTEGFRPFVDGLRPLGFVTNESFNVIDVTDQYTDMDRRKAVNEKIMARLQDLIKEKSYQFKDLLAVEQELAKLQSETEQIKGQMMGLDDRVALSTLTLTMYQEASQQVVPPDSAFAPLMNTIENAGPQFKRSVHAIMAFLGFLVRLVIWLVPWIIPIGIIWWLVRRWIRKIKARRRIPVAQVKE